MKAVKHFFWTLVFLAVVVVGGAVAYAYSGWYDLSVGSGHTAPVQWYLDTLRHNAIERASADIRVPPLDDPELVDAGAQAYQRACAGCHGRPGRPPSDSWEPAPPALTRHEEDPAELFWVVRNGIKMSAMPRIGPERLADEQIWQIAAFLQDASSLTEGEYRMMVEPPAPEPAPARAEDAAGDEADGEAEETDAPEADANEAASEDDGNQAGGNDGT